MSEEDARRLLEAWLYGYLTTDSSKLVTIGYVRRLLTKILKALNQNPRKKRRINENDELAIQKAIDEAIERLASDAPKLAAHLRKNIRVKNGRFIYLDTDTKWNLDKPDSSQKIS